MNRKVKCLHVLDQYCLYYGEEGRAEALLGSTANYDAARWMLYWLEAWQELAELEKTLYCAVHDNEPEDPREAFGHSLEVLEAMFVNVPPAPYPSCVRNAVSFYIESIEGEWQLMCAYIHQGAWVKIAAAAMWNEQAAQWVVRRIRNTMLIERHVPEVRHVASPIPHSEEYLRSILQRLWQTVNEYVENALPDDELVVLTESFSEGYKEEVSFNMPDETYTVVTRLDRHTVTRHLERDNRWCDIVTLKQEAQARWLARRLTTWTRMEEIVWDTWGALYNQTVDIDKEEALGTLCDETFELLERADAVRANGVAWASSFIPNIRTHPDIHFGGYEEENTLWLCFYSGERMAKLFPMDYHTEIVWLAYRLNATHHALVNWYDESKKALESGEDAETALSRIYHTMMDSLVENAPGDDALEEPRLLAKFVIE